MEQGLRISGLGIMPLQLLNLGILIPRVFFRFLITRTPRGKLNWIIVHTLTYMAKLFGQILPN